MFKRTLSLLLCLLVAVPSLAFCAFAQENEVSPAEISFLFIVFSFLFLTFFFLSLRRLCGIIPFGQSQFEYIKICKTCQRKFTEKCQIEQTYGEDLKIVTKKYIKNYILLRKLC